MRKEIKIAIGLVLIGLFVVVLTASPLMTWNRDNEGKIDWSDWGWGQEEEPVIIIDDTTPSVYNLQKAWDDVPIKVSVKNYYPYNRPNIPGLAVEIRDSGGYVDSGTTDINGAWVSTVETFDSEDVYTLILGGIATTNKSQEYSFIVQGQNGDSKPPYIHCGTFLYKPVVEEGNIAFAFYTKAYVAMTAINLTADYVSDHVVEGYIKATFSAISYGLGRNMFSSTKGDVSAYICFIFTEINSTNSNAIRGQSSDGYLGIGGGTGAHHIVCQVEEIAYQTDEDGDIVGNNEAIHWFYFKFDFSACGIPTTYTAATAERFSLAGIVSFEYDYELFASSGAAYNSGWFSDTDLTAILVTT